MSFGQKTLASSGRSVHTSVVGRRLGFFAHLLLCAGLLDAAVVEAPVHKGASRLEVEMLPGAHQRRVVDQGVEELPAPPGPLGARHFGLFLLLMDQLDPWGTVRRGVRAGATRQFVCTANACGSKHTIF